jgi:hypothetical protein
MKLASVYIALCRFRMRHGQPRLTLPLGREQRELKVAASADCFCSG